MQEFDLRVRQNAEEFLTNEENIKLCSRIKAIGFAAFGLIDSNAVVDSVQHPQNIEENVLIGLVGIVIGLCTYLAARSEANSLVEKNGYLAREIVRDTFVQDLQERHQSGL